MVFKMDKVKSIFPPKVIKKVFSKTIKLLKFGKKK